VSKRFFIVPQDDQTDVYRYVTWRWVFYLNLCISPISLFITVLVLKLPQPKTNYLAKIRDFDYLGLLALCGGTVCLLLALSWGGNNVPWNGSEVIGCFVGGSALICVFITLEHFAHDPLVFPTFFKSRTLVAIFFAEFFYGANLLGMMYYIPQFFQLVFGDSAIISGVGLLPMMLGLAIGNPVAAVITSRYGVSLWNAVAGAALEVLASGLMTRWTAHTSRADAVILLIVLGIGQGAVMSGLLLSAQVAVPPQQVGIVTGLVIFLQTVGDIFGIATFAAVYVNKLRSSLQDINLDPQQTAEVLSDVQLVKKFPPDVKSRVVLVYAESLQNGWWLMFACACALLICTALSRQHKFAPS
jgi:MFS family permease